MSTRVYNTSHHGGGVEIHTDQEGRQSMVIPLGRDSEQRRTLGQLHEVAKAQLVLFEHGGDLATTRYEGAHLQ